MDHTAPRLVDLDAFQFNNAAQRIPLVNRAEMVAAMPTKHRDHAGECPCGLRQSKPNCVSAVDQAPTSSTIVMMDACDVQSQTRQFRSTADNITANYFYRFTDLQCHGL
ncbi:hypothetical protein UI24_23250 [Mycobacteroides franklinii]|nr:hypothetical protein [Mycobacteroides franklinii]